MKVSPSAFQMSRHLADGLLMPPDSACSFCSSATRTPVCVLQEHPDVTLLKCANCGAATASRIPTAKALDDYYRDYYKNPEFANHHHRVTCDSTHRFGRYLAARLTKYSKISHGSSIRILDFGGGDGSIAVETARHLQRKGLGRADIAIVDYNVEHDETPFTDIDARISLTRHSVLENLPHKAFDVVLASGVVEHLPRPKEILTELLSLLHEQGVFYARTPYVVPFIKVLKLFGIKWDFFFPAHIHDLGQDFWKSCFSTIFVENEFVVLASSPSIVETSFRDHFLTTLAAHAFKTPWYLFGERYSLVGGWEVFVRKK